jgi:hypothetical protein
MITFKWLSTKRQHSTIHFITINSLFMSLEAKMYLRGNTKLINHTEMEFKELEPRFKSAKTPV